MNKEYIERVLAHPYKITLTESKNPDNYLKCRSEKRHIQLFFSNKKLFFVGQSLTGSDIKKEMKLIPMLSNLVDDIMAVVNAEPKKKKIMLYDLLVDMLECMGFDPPLIELNYELIHNYAHWIEEAKRYYHSARILQKNYVEVINKHGKLKRRSSRNTIKLSEAYDTDKIIIYLYSRVLECILKSRIYYRFQVVLEYLTEKRKIRDERFVKRWVENNMHTHNIKQLAVWAGCCPRKKDERNDHDQITNLLMEGKYPGPKKKVLYDGIVSEQLEIELQSKIASTSKKRRSEGFIEGEEMFDYFNQIVLNAIERCYGKNFRDSFSEWHRAKILRRMVVEDMDYKKEIRERNAMIKMARRKHETI